MDLQPGRAGLHLRLAVDAAVRVGRHRAGQAQQPGQCRQPPPHQRMATGLMMACTPPVMRDAPRVNMNSQALSFTSSEVSMFSRM